jgi:hypothetical protein
MTQAEEEGGCRLVAVVSGAEDELVAEAGYALLLTATASSPSPLPLRGGAG